MKSNELTIAILEANIITLEARIASLQRFPLDNAFCQEVIVIHKQVKIIREKIASQVAKVEERLVKPTVNVCAASKAANNDWASREKQRAKYYGKIAGARGRESVENPWSVIDDRHNAWREGWDEIQIADRAFTEGYLSFVEGNVKGACPYGFDATINRAEWHKGWNAGKIDYEAIMKQDSQNA